MKKIDDFERMFFNEELKNVAKKSRKSTRNEGAVRAKTACQTNGPVMKTKTACQTNGPVMRTNNACSTSYANIPNGTQSIISYEPASESYCSTNNEYIAIIIAVCIVYAVQLLSLFKLGNDGLNWYNYLPSLKLQIVFMPIIAWSIMALIGIDWLDTWSNFTSFVLSVCIPLEIMVMVLILVSPLSLFSFMTWITILGISIIVGLIIYAIIRD